MLFQTSLTSSGSGSAARRIYWVSTGLLALGMAGAGIQELRQAPELLEAARRLGYPDYVLTILGVAKLGGAALLVIPNMPRAREWAYAGFAFDFGGAILSHTFAGDTLAQTLPAMFALALMLTSYASYRTTLGATPGLAKEAAA